MKRRPSMRPAVRRYQRGETTMFRGRRIPAPSSLALLGTLLIAPAAAQNFGTAAQPVTLADYKFEPGAIHLAAGKPVVLRLTNDAKQPHEFAAPEFFAGAAVSPSSAKFINKEGEAEVAPGEHVDIALVPKAGTYHLQCNKPGHAALGMKGTIIVK
jgi:uncharacterized cupredoxin-like copper-binding protein